MRRKLVQNVVFGENEAEENKQHRTQQEANYVGLKWLLEIHREQLEINNRLNSEIELRSLHLQQMNTNIFLRSFVTMKFLQIFQTKLMLFI